MSDAEELRQAVRAALDDPNGVLADILGELQQLRQAAAEGRPFTMIATGIVDAAGQSIVDLGGPGVGKVWHLERVGFAVGGASNAAAAALYLDSPAADVDLLDYVGALGGVSPSRSVFNDGPYLIPNGTPALLVITGAVVGASVSARFQGRQIEVETSGGRV